MAIYLGVLHFLSLNLMGFVFPCFSHLEDPDKGLLLALTGLEANILLCEWEP
jgi:hypothetical protein